MALRQSPHFTGNSYVLKQNKAAANGTKKHPPFTALVFHALAFLVGA